MGFFSFLFGSGKKKEPKAPKAAKGAKSAKSARAAKKAPPPKPKAPEKAKPVKKTNIAKRFDLQGRIGQGSMSKVYRAYDRNLGKTICLKVLDKEKTKRFEDRFIGLHKPNEGMICQALKHANIVTTYEWGLTAVGEQFLVMEFVEGLGFNFLIETRHRQLEGHRIELLAQAAEGLAYMHDAGYMHRDICPRNMMVTTEGVVKLIDFGLAIPDRPEFRRPGNRTGTAHYMAPELIKRSPTDPRVDLFALGVMAYETFTGRLPWLGTESREILDAHLNQRPKDPRDFRKDLDPALVAFLLKSIERDPRDRFQNALAFRDALKALPKQDY